MRIAQYKNFFVTEASERLASFEDLLVKLERDGLRTESIQEMLVTIHTLKSDAATMNFQNLATVLHQTEDYLQSIQRGERGLPKTEIDQLFILIDAIRDDLKSIKEHDTEIDLQSQAAFMLREGAPPTKQQNKPTRERQNLKESQYKPLNSYVEVPAEKMDEALDKVHDLIAENQQLNRLIKKKDIGAMAIVLHSQETKLSAVRQAMIDIKMMPVKQYFGFLSRLVRDLSREGKKFVTLSFADNNLRFERQVLEKLRSICVQLIRNAVEHGFKEGEKGVVTIEFSYKAQKIVVTVHDSGNGIDWDAIAKQAVAQKQITKRELESVSGMKRKELLFTLGVSSREEVTMQAGRGIGWASIQKDVQALDGSIAFEEKRTGNDKGTRFIVAVPLQPSMFRAITWKWGSYQLAMPLFAVDNVIQLEDKAMPLHKRFKAGKESVPVIDLKALFGSEIPVYSADSVAIVAHEGKKLAFPLPGNVNEQELVLEELPCLRNKEMILGAAVSDASTPVIILNYLSLFN